MVIDIANLSYFHFDLMFEIGLNRERIKQIMDDKKKSIGLEFKFENVKAIPRRSNW